MLCLEKQQKLVERARHNFMQGARELMESGSLDLRVGNVMAGGQGW